MNYELALKLKEAGFPQEGKNGYWINSAGVTSSIKKEAPYVPTLSELIEACGSQFLMLRRGLGDKPNHIIDKKEGAWMCECAAWDRPRFLGDTPEEAVANLWLSLNKK